MKNARNIALCGMIAAMYAALCFALAPLSFGIGQVRVAEALTLLPVFSPLGVWGVTVGCLVSNLAGWLTGANILGFLDIFFGTAATLIAAILSRKLRRIRWAGLPVLSSLPPVLVNAVIIGAELSWAYTPAEFLKGFWTFGLSVAFGQAISCIGIGLLLVTVLERSGAARLLAAE